MSNFTQRKRLKPDSDSEESRSPEVTKENKEYNMQQMLEDLKKSRHKANENIKKNQDAIKRKNHSEDKMKSEKKTESKKIQTNSSIDSANKNNKITINNINNNITNNFYLKESPNKEIEIIFNSSIEKKK